MQNDSSVHVVLPSVSAGVQRGGEFFLAPVLAFSLITQYPTSVQYPYLPTYQTVVSIHNPIPKQLLKMRASSISAAVSFVAQTGISVHGLHSPTFVPETRSFYPEESRLSATAQGAFPQSPNWRPSYYVNGALHMPDEADFQNRVRTCLFRRQG